MNGDDSHISNMNSEDSTHSANVWRPVVIQVDDARLGVNAYAHISGTETAWNTPNKTQYARPSSNAQITAIGRSHTQDKYKLLYLLERHGIRTDPKSIASSKPDSYYYKCLQQHTKEINTARDNGQATHLNYHLQCGLQKVKVQLAGCNYVDVGGDTGGISIALGRLVGAKSVTVVDPGYNNPLPGATYYTTLAPLGDASQDLATCIFSMHHFTDLPGMLKGIARMIKPGGVLFIKEHDCWNAIDAMMVDVEHSLFMTSYGETITDTHTCHFKNYVGWAAVIQSAGFTLVHTCYFSPPREEITPTRAFCATFIRNDSASSSA